jgi:CDP-paratose 2-epimerase
MNIIITGGAGFIGANAAARYLRLGHRVTVIDDLSRRGTADNLSWLRTLGGYLTVATADIRNESDVARVFRDHPDTHVVLHLAAQVAVTTSVTAPRHDFEVNALGTFNVLEAARSLPGLRAFLYASTNKVYGGMDDANIVEHHGRYAYEHLPLGVSEDRSLDFHSPYGCSKGAADQYVLDYYRIYGLPTVSLRQSCIYGPRQFGVEDQGWVAWFCIAAALDRPITIYGDGKQVRDVLHVEDLLDVYDAAIGAIGDVRGRAYNIGGGPTNTLSLLELIAHLEERLRRPLAPAFDDWRPGDQRVFISDISRARQELGWKPRIGIPHGIDELLAWVERNRNLLASADSPEDARDVGDLPRP